MKKAIGIAICILFLPFIVNVPDAKLDEDAARIISSSQEPIDPETDNGFYALLGFEAPLGKDIYEAGSHAYTVYSKSQDNDPPDCQFSLEAAIGPRPELPAPNLIPRCDPGKQDCLRYYSEQEAPLLRLIEENAILLERYASLKNYAFFQNDIKPAPWAPQVRLERGILSGTLLTAGKAAILFNKGNHEEALQLLVTDIVLWRKLLAEGSELPNKIYSFLALRLNYSLLEEMLDRLSSKEASALVNWDVIAPLTPEEISTDVVWDRQFRALAWSLSNNRWPFDSDQKELMSFLERWFCKSNATLNDAYAMFHLLKELSTVKPDKVEQVREAFSQRLGDIGKVNPQKLYNPLGKNFVSISFDDRAGTHWNRDIQSLDQLISRTRDKIES